MNKNPQRSCKKPYQSPSLRTYGDVQILTRTTKASTNSMDNSGVGGANKTN